MKPLTAPRARRAPGLDGASAAPIGSGSTIGATGYRGGGSVLAPISNGL